MPKWLDEYKSARVPNKGSKSKELTKKNKTKSGKSKVSPSGSDEWICQACQKGYKDDDDLVITCDCCENYWCADCIQMPEETFRAVQREDLFWFCPPCSQKVTTLIRDDSQPEQQ
eukprot:gene19526-21455_t